MKAYYSNEVQNNLNNEWAEYKKSMTSLMKRITPDEYLMLRDEGITKIILQKADAKSDGVASTLGLEISEVARLYKLDYLFDAFKEVQRLERSVYRDFYSNESREPNEKMAQAFILKQSEIQFTKVQQILVKRAERISMELTKLQEELREQGATSLPIGRVVNVKYDNSVEVNLPFIKTVVR